MKLNHRIMIITFCAGLALGLMVISSVYFLIRHSLFNELKNRLKNITALSGQIINPDSFEYLSGMCSLPLSDAERAVVEKSAEYNHLGTQICEIQNIDSTFIKYVYVLSPTENPDVAKVILDGDSFLQMNDQETDDSLQDEDILRFGDDFDVSPFPVMKEAFQSRENIVEDVLYWDEETEIWSISGYAPVFSSDKDTFYGIIGIDIADKQVQKVLGKSVRIMLIMFLISVILSIVLSYLMSSRISAPVLALNFGVNELINSNFTKVSAIKIMTNDELGDLGKNFNLMGERLIESIKANEETTNLLYSLNESYQRFVPSEFLNLLEKRDIIDVMIGEHIEREMTILFSDIRNFTAFSEQLTPEENFKFLNSYLNQMTPIIRVNSGFVDKFIGDAVMALFPGNAEDGLKSAIEMQRYMTYYNMMREKYNYKPLSIGIGLHSGRVMLGTVGDENRMEGTVISDTVNISARVENLNKVFGSFILVSQEIISSLADPEKYSYRFLGKIMVKGKRKWIGVFEIFDGYDDETRFHKLANKENFELGINYFLKRDFDAAIECFQNVLESDPDDKAAALYLKNARNCFTKSVDDSWDGVLVINGLDMIDIEDI